jgi:hypothetical protein
MNGVSAGMIRPKPHAAAARSAITPIVDHTINAVVRQRS